MGVAHALHAARDDSPRAPRAQGVMPSMIAFMPEPHILLTVTQPVASNSLAPNAACRAGACPSPAGRTQAHDNFVDHVGGNARARHGRLDGAGAKLGRRRVLQRAEKGAHGRARAPRMTTGSAALIVAPFPATASRHQSQGEARQPRQAAAGHGRNAGSASPSPRSIAAMVSSSTCASVAETSEGSDPCRRSRRERLQRDHGNGADDRRREIH